MSKKIYGVTVGTPMSPAAIAEKLKPVKTVNGVAPDENGNVNVEGGGMSATASALLITILRNGVYSTDQSANITALAAEFGVTEEEPDAPVVPDIPDEPDEPDVPEKTLTSIYATYSGGDVAVGTAVTDLTGIVVTAHYSDGTSETVTEYTLSGTIAEGENIITVSYGGKTTAFAVTGVAEDEGVVALTWEAGQINNSGIQIGGSHSNIFDVRDATKVYVTTTSNGWTAVNLRTFNSIDDEVGAGTGPILGNGYIDGDVTTDNRPDTMTLDVSSASFVCVSLTNYNETIAAEHITVRKE